MNKDQRESPRFRAVLWDFDGTIMDSQAGILRSMRHSLETLGCEVPPNEEFGTWVGPPFPKSLRNWTSLDAAGVEEAGVSIKTTTRLLGLMRPNLSQG